MADYMFQDHNFFLAFLVFEAQSKISHNKDVTQESIPVKGYLSSLILAPVENWMKLEPLRRKKTSSALSVPASQTSSLPLAADMVQ